MRISPQLLGPMHFIGIGGIGMSGIAHILASMGYTVQGSDQSESANVERLRAKGIAVTIGQHSHNLGQATVIVISSAVKATNPELIEARRRGLPVVKRAEMLAEVMRLRPSIAIAGTHGKTTTTSLGAAVLEAGGLDPTVISGGIINAYGTNARLGQGEWIIAEADESDGSFIKLPATIAVITNIEPEHMDFYDNFEQIKDAFYTFVENIPFYGLAVLCHDHQEIKNLIPRLTDRRVITYGLQQGCDVQATNIRSTDENMIFDLKFSAHFSRLCPQAVFEANLTSVNNIILSLLGEHNISNALATIICGLELGMSFEHIRQGLQQFSGVNRRFTPVATINDIKIIDDYAHHPTEIRVVLKTARMLCKRKVIAVMQPHRYSRLHYLFDDFIQCFKDADHIIITSIYNAGEDPIEDINHETLAQAIAQLGKSVFKIETQQELAPLLASLALPGDYIICMGAGSITKWAHDLSSQLGHEIKNDSSNSRSHSKGICKL